MPKTSVFLTELVENHPVARVLTPQIIRSVSASSLIYAEAVSAESFKDLIHKLALVEKELRETKTCLELLLCLTIANTILEKTEALYKETDELIAIISSSLFSLRSKMRKNLGM